MDFNHKTDLFEKLSEAILPFIEHGYSLRVVSNALKSCEKRFRREFIVAMHKKGLSDEEIQELTGYTRTPVQVAIREYYRNYTNDVTI